MSALFDAVLSHLTTLLGNAGLPTGVFFALSFVVMALVGVGGAVYLVIDTCSALAALVRRSGGPEHRKGNPRIPTVDEIAGDVLRKKADNAHFVRPYHGIAAGTKLKSMNTTTLINLLDAFQKDGYYTDIYIATVHMDSVHPEWRRQRKAKNAADVGSGNKIYRAKFTQGYHGISAGTSFDELSSHVLIDVLHDFKRDGLADSVTMMEAYLDRSRRGWRTIDKHSQEDAPRRRAIPSARERETAYDVLGVLPTTPFKEIAAAFRGMMQAAQALPNTAPQRRLIRAFQEIKKTHAQTA